MTYNQELSLLGEAGGGGHVIPLNLLNLDAIEPRKPESGIYCLFFSAKGTLYEGLDNGSLATISGQRAQLLRVFIRHKPVASPLREQAIRQARAEQRSNQFWEGVGRLVGNLPSSAGSSAATGTWVNSYPRRDGTRVRGYRRR